SQVAYWEMGNEPDVDPIWVPSNSPYGCWGDIRDTYYGGERYGRMLRAVVPAMRAANPSVKIVLGGLLLDTPNTTDPTRGKPERFLEGVLRSGAADSFDIVAYHAYTSYTQPNFDHDLNNGADWPPRGGWTLGKAAYVRDVLARYGVSKPLWLNETSMVCSPTWSQCDPPGDEFFAAQADHLIRVMTRAAAANIQQISWFTFNGPGWRNGSLLDTNQSPRPSFTAYKRLIEMVGQYQSVSAVDYGQEIEAYRFVKPGGVVDVLWSRSASTVIALVPSGSYRSAVIWNGAEPSTGTSPDGTQKYVNVGFQAVFIERAP
ncbi:hypothetical protein K2Z83_21060, partial [Oscillochloris sp. ZM17-4]|nr:hypothetical protein [Oscillochloris sp. ZM17-4]